MGHEAEAQRDTKPGAGGPVAAEDEDLFDFPVIEMELEVEPPAAPLPVGQVARAPLASLAPAPSSPPAAPVRAAPPPASADHGETPGTTDDAKSGAAAPDHAESPVPTSDGDVRRAAELIEGLESVLDGANGLPGAARLRRGARSRVVATSGSPIALLAGMLLLNLLTFAFFWHVSRSFREGMQSLRDDLMLVSKGGTILETVQAAPGKPSTPARDPQPEKAQEHATPEHSPADPVQPASARPGIPFERTTLELAAQEIRAGEMLSARKRLYRLLAMADRVEPELRADVEARARFMIADSYAEQATLRSRELGSRTPGAPRAAGADAKDGGH